MEAGKDIDLALTCKQCISSNRKLGDKRDCRVDINFKNAFNARSQAALWQVMRMFKILDVDLLEQIHAGANVKLAPNNEESATTTFNSSTR